jgi:hypothetical protein
VSFYIRIFHIFSYVYIRHFLAQLITFFDEKGEDTEFSTNEGPIISFAASRPGRITYYTKQQYYPNNEIKDKFGSLFTLISRKEITSNLSQIIGVYLGIYYIYVYIDIHVSIYILYCWPVWLHLYFLLFVC